MTRTLSAVLVTLGDPNTMTGGYLFHRRLAELAPRHAARLDFAAFPDRAFPLAILDAPRMVRSLDRLRPDVVVLDSIAAAFLAFQRPIAPVVGMLHQPPGGIDHRLPRTVLQTALDRLAYRHVVRLLAASDALADQLRRGGYARRDVRVVPPGRDVAETVGASPGDLRQGRRAALLCVGNWVERKGILSLLDAFATLDGDAATLHLVGNPHADQAYERHVRARLAQPDLAQRTIVHGPLALEQVAAMYAAADAFVLPSLKEPFGTVYGEAMAFGLPVVGWRAGNLPHLAENEREGLFVEPGDLAGLAAAMRRLSDDPELRTRLGTAARQRALKRPTWDEVAGVFFDELRDVAAAAQASRPT